MSSEKDQVMNPRPSRALPIKPPPRGIDLPCDDGEPMETHLHVLQMTLLTGSLELAWKDRDDYFVGGNMFVYYSELQSKRNDFRGPDVFVVLNTTKNPFRRSWVVWEENGRRPDLVIELISESTEAEDRGPKKEIYAKLLGTPEYYLYDPLDQRLEGYVLDSATKAYCPMKKDASGRYWSEALQLGLGVALGEYENAETLWLRWFDREGKVLPHAEELAQAEAREKEAAVARADEAVARAAAEAREKEAAVARADEAVARAEADANRVKELLAKLAQYEKGSS
jgi:Uma2 family endonuclease